MKKIAIIGGGAAGMTAAITAAKESRGAEICILEHKEAVGKKILSTGNGRCNLTNEFLDFSCYYSENPEIVRQVLKRYGREETLQFFRETGIYVKSKNGYYYPRSEQASAVRELFESRLNNLGVKIRTGLHVNSIKKERAGFRIYAAEKDTRERAAETCIKADKVILTSGGMAAPVLGSDGSGYRLAKGLGHSIVPVVPALVQLRIKNHPLKKAAGVRTEGRVSIYDDKRLMGTDTGELQLTAYGISGIPVFQVSRHAAKALYHQRPVRAEIDFLPEIPEEALAGMLRRQKKKQEKKSISEILLGMLNKNLIPGLLKCAKIPPQLKAEEFSAPLLKNLVRTCKQLSLEIEDTNGFENAQVCAGGVRLSEVNAATMESLRCPQLYLAGEILDADGICGGYNLQWAWATGSIAGLNAAAD